MITYTKVKLFYKVINTKKIDADVTSDMVDLIQKQLNLMLWDHSIDKNTHNYLLPEEHKIRTPVCYTFCQKFKKTNKQTNKQTKTKSKTSRW